MVEVVACNDQIRGKRERDGGKGVYEITASGLFVIVVDSFASFDFLSITGLCEM
jgi:hypothetical protein